MNESDSGPVKAERTADSEGAVSQGTLRVPARPPYLALIGMVVTWHGHRAGLSDEECCELEGAVDEACTNVIQYAYSGANSRDITICCSSLPRGIQVDILDRGKPFDLAAGIEIARQKQASDPALGGLGLSLIRQLADDVRHRWDKQEGNRLTIIKYKKE
jgi:serine/threonine-protein kinase RsbW